MAQARVERRFTDPHVHLFCRCGWDGYDDDIEDWAVDSERDRVVRRCPRCDDPVPEWGAIPSIDGAKRVARGPLREALGEAVSGE